MSGIEGETELRERLLDHLSGYADSRPVRVGNGARADYVAQHWTEPDHGLWEMRKEYVYGKIMSWVALDRAIRLCGTTAGNERGIGFYPTCARRAASMNAAISLDPTIARKWTHRCSRLR